MSAVRERQHLVQECRQPRRLLWDQDLPGLDFRGLRLEPCQLVTDRLDRDRVEGHQGIVTEVLAETEAKPCLFDEDATSLVMSLEGDDLPLEHREQQTRFSFSIAIALWGNFGFLSK